MQEETYLPLTNDKTAEAFNSHVIVDQWVEVPPRGESCSCKAWSGNITDIIPCAAKRYVDFGGNLLSAKEASPENHED